MTGSTRVDIAAVIGPLAEARRWVCWRSETRGSRPTKVPYSPAGGRASSTDPATWGTLDEALRAREAREYDGVGIVLRDGLGGVDLDGCRDPETGAIAPWAQTLIDGFHSYAEVSPSGTGVKILAYGAPGKLPASTIPIDTPSANGKRPAIECYVTGRYFAITGEILDGSPDEIRNCGEVGDAWDQMVRRLQERANGRRERRTGEATGADEMSLALYEALEHDPQLRALWEEGNDGGADRSRNDAALACALAAKGFSNEDIEAALRCYRLGQIGQGVLTGKKADRQVARLLGLAAEARERLNGTGDETGARDLTHDGLALQLGDAWPDARHVAAWGQWLFYGPTIWRPDETLEHMTRARRFLRDLSDRLPPKLKAAARTLRQADTVAKVVGLARSNPMQAATVEQWDADPWALGTPAGTVDLRSGELREARADDYITKSTAVAPAAPGTSAPLWSRFLEEIAPDAELRAYLQRFFGYGLTGSTREHAFAFGHGTGANGKGVTLNTVKGILGDYAISIPTEMLMVSHNERHPTELARLRGVRLAIGSETEEGTRWAESRIKALTGGDPIAARYMRQDFFEFDPQFKLFVVGNKRPSLRGVDEAIRRRLHLVPFTLTVPAERRDHDLPEKLRAEWPAILRWMIDGCIAWQREGLNPPESVQDATASYLEAEDALSLWMEECADQDPNAWESSGTLFGSWKRWAERAGEYVGSQKRFTATLEDRGLRTHRQGGSGLRGFCGLRLRAHEPDFDARYR